MIFFDNEGLAFLQFIDHQYQELLTTRQAIAAFKINVIWQS